MLELMGEEEPAAAFEAAERVHNNVIAELPILQRPGTASSASIHRAGNPALSF